jgi:hypothetical protein
MRHLRNLDFSLKNSDLFNFLAVEFSSLAGGDSIYILIASRSCYYFLLAIMYQEENLLNVTN